ncbi:MAG: transcription termination factor NusA [Candidatus Euphemobacter frigidus]|nr:transcription termination factor NusA [Candidatus Euphemobacter frigidus]MDP8276254.1 transcription termination factor NusA [Candidatus Euphemobacter frigidus]
MNSDLIAVLDHMEREKGIPRKVLIEAIQASLLSASKKSIGPARELEVTIDPKTGDIKAFSKLIVVERVADPYGEISLENARKITSKAALGDEVTKEVTPKNFGRIAAQTGKQVVIQKIREAEKNIVFGEYQGRIGELVSGVIRHYDKQNVIIDLGRTEGIMPPREQCHHEEYRLGARLRTYILDVRERARGPEVILSRTHPNFVRRLFELEVPEIDEGVVEIKAIAREAGYRTKIAVWAAEDKVDCVGACVGLRGNRVKSVVRELNGEKIDIIRWDEDPVTYITNALSPAKLKQVTIDEKGECEVVVDEDQLSLTIGKKGQNVRLSSRLTGWKIDIFREGEVLKGVKSAITVLRALPGVGEKMARNLVEAGFTGLPVIAISDPADLTQVEGIGEKTAEELIKAARERVE